MKRILVRKPLETAASGNSILQKGGLFLMTAMEWILVTEVIVLALLAVLLVILVLRGRKKAAAAPHNANAYYAEYAGRQPAVMQSAGSPVPGQVPCPGGYTSGDLSQPFQAPAYSMSYYGHPGYGPYARPVPAQTAYGQAQQGGNGYPQTSFGVNPYGQPVYEQTVYGQGTFPGYPQPGGFGGAGVYGNPGNYGVSGNGNAYGYGTPQAGGYAPRGGYIPSPVIGEEKTILVPPEKADPSPGRKNKKETHHQAARAGKASNDRAADREKTTPRAVHGSTPDRRSQTRWRVDFMEMSSGRQVSRDFRNELVVGRQMPAPLESGRLYLSMDATVSRAQFCLFVTDEGIMIENLSKVNVTRKNGYPLWQPVLLEEGDILEMGRMRYMVKGIHPAA